MKKQSIVIAGLLIMVSGLYGVTANDIVKNLEFYCTDTFDKEYLFGRMQFNPLLWNSTIEEMEAFVTDKSKNLVGSKDSALMNTLTKIKNANMNLLDTIKAIQTIYPDKNKTALQKQLAPISEIINNMEDVKIKLSQMSFTLTHKKEAQDLLTNAASYVGKAATKVRLKLLAQIDTL